jgi:hypothetical protein
VTLHLLKLAVGATGVESMRAYQAKRLENEGTLQHVTRFRPKRAEEVLAGGSLYWVVKHQIRVRQRILDFVPVRDSESGTTKWGIVLDPELVLTYPVHRRPHQGWRYFQDANAPADLLADAPTGFADMPQEMAAELRLLGLI